MPAMLDDLIAQVLTLEIKLLSCRAPKPAPMARPCTTCASTPGACAACCALRDLPAAQVLNEAAREVGALSTPLRDLEVLIVELESHGLAHLAEPRRQRLREGYLALLAAPALAQLFRVLDAWPQLLRISHREGLLVKPRKTIRKRLARTGSAWSRPWRTRATTVIACAC